ncbi:MAG TPA: L,D-transpeptidase [Gemmatimonadaceae bacterium]|jgi:hypothetical protein|nr:L,D-transpeptidase [Gemmatimonadaceae bacterium]
MFRFLRHGGLVAWALFAGIVLFAGLSAALLADAAEVRYERDVTRMVFNDNLEVLNDIRAEVGAVSDSLGKLATVPEARPYLVVSIAENRVWFKQGDSVLFEAPVATGSGKEMVRDGGGETWRFETPRGRLVVQNKEVDPQWVPPDWHFVEAARNRGLGVQRMTRGQTIALPGGAVLAVKGNEVVKRMPDGRVVPYGKGTEGREIVANGNIVIPPFGTSQRKYPGVLGTRRLNLGDGYALHGTNKPETVGRSVSHGCIRLKNPDIERLYEMVPVGTPVFVY